MEGKLRTVEEKLPVGSVRGEARIGGLGTTGGIERAELRLLMG